MTNPENNFEISVAGFDVAMDAEFKEFEAVVADLARAKYCFRLYVSGNTRRSAAAIENVRSICEQYLSGRYELQTIDVHQQPTVATQAQLVAVPTLIKELPLPIQKFVGDMSNTERIVIGLKLGR